MNLLLIGRIKFAALGFALIGIITIVIKKKERNICASIVKQKAVRNQIKSIEIEQLNLKENQ